MVNSGSVEITQIDNGYLIEAEWFWNESAKEYRETAEEALKCAKEFLDKIYKENFEVEE